MQIVAALAVAQASAASAIAAAGPEVLPIWPGMPPGTENWTGPETTTRLTVSATEQLEMVSNVTVPTLTVFRPKPGTANGTAIIIAPGGGFMNLAVQHEGWDVARWLADRGITALVLKYRVRPWPLRLPTDARHHPEQLDEALKVAEPQRQIAAADGIQAMHYLRENAGRLGVESNRIGFMGFSAGSYTTMRVVLDSPVADRPNFAAPIYGAMDDKVPPKDAPPLFIAAAQDDAIVPVSKSIAIFNAWTAADRPAELHLYEKGGHGFGARHLNRPVDGWLPAFGVWLADHGWMAKP